MATDVGAMQGIFGEAVLGPAMVEGLRDGVLSQRSYPLPIRVRRWKKANARSRRLAGLKSREGVGAAPEGGDGDGS